MYSNNRGPPKIIKPIIYFNGEFHYVEESKCSKVQDSQHALFLVYNLNKSFGELKQEIIDTIGGTGVDVEQIEETVAHNEKTGHSMGSSFITVNKNYKIKISFKNKRYRDVVESLRSSEIIETFSENGFADWIPLDIATYTNIERSSKCDYEGQGDGGSKFRSFSDDLDETFISTVIDELCTNQEKLALGKLFPGPVTYVHREVNDVLMSVYHVEIKHLFENEMGALFISVLNALIEDRKSNLDHYKAHSAFSITIVRLLVVIRDILYLNELYGEFVNPTWVPFISQPLLKEIKDIIPQKFNSIEVSLNTANISDQDHPFNKLLVVIRQLTEEIETAQKKLHDEVSEWKKPQKTSSVLFYGSIASAIAIPAVYLYNKRTLTAHNIKSTIGCVLSITTSLWAHKVHKKFQNAIEFKNSVEPIFATTINSIDALDKWLAQVGQASEEKQDGKTRLYLDDFGLKGRRNIFKKLLGVVASNSADLRRSFNLIS